MVNLGGEITKDRTSPAQKTKHVVYQGPVHLSPVDHDWADPLTWTKVTVGSYDKFQPGSEMRKGRRRVEARNSITFAPII